MKDTDDESLVDGTDAGAIPATSTNYQTLAGRNVHGGKCMPEWYYYTPNQWARLGMWGPLPNERNIELRGVKQGRRTDEDVSEESDTKT